MKAKLIQIGNSRGVRLPKPLIKDAGLEDEVDIQLRDGTIVITSTRKLRAGLSESAKLLHDRKQDSPIDSPSMTQFDKTEWQW
jgi:antitoxin MazE